MKLSEFLKANAFRVRVSLLMCLFVACLWAGRNGGGGDFRVLRESVTHAWQGEFSKVYDKEASGPFFYPPAALVVFGPFSIPNSWSLAVLMNLIFHSVAFWGMWWGLKEGFPNLFSNGHPLLAWWVVWLFSLAPVHLDFMGQNINLPLCAALIGIELLRQKNSKTGYWAAGFLSAIVGWTKIFPAFVTVFYFLLGPKELRLGTILGFIVGLISPWLFFGSGGIDLYSYFYQTLTIYHEKNLIFSNSTLNLPGWIAVWGRPWFSQSILSLLIALVPAIVMVIFLALMMQDPLKKEKSIEFSYWTLAVSLMAFLNSSSRPDYFMFYLPGFCCVISQWKESRRLEKCCLLGAFLFISLTQQAMVGRDLNIRLQDARIPVVGIALLIVAQVMSLVRQRTRLVLPH